MPLFDNQVVFLGQVALTVSTAAVSVTASSIPPGAAGVVLACNTGGAVNWLPGQDPTISFGIPLAVGGVEVLEHENISDLRFIRTGAANALMTVMFIACKNQPF